MSCRFPLLGLITLNFGAETRIFAHVFFYLLTRSSYLEYSRSRTVVSPLSWLLRGLGVLSETTKGRNMHQYIYILMEGIFYFQEAQRRITNCWLRHHPCHVLMVTLHVRGRHKRGRCRSQRNSQQMLVPAPQDHRADGYSCAASSDSTPIVLSYHPDFISSVTECNCWLYHAVCTFQTAITAPFNQRLLCSLSAV